MRAKTLLLAALAVGGCSAGADPGMTPPDLLEEPPGALPMSSVLVCLSVPQYGGVRQAVEAWSVGTGVTMTLSARVDGDWAGCNVLVRNGDCSRWGATAVGCAWPPNSGEPGAVWLTPGKYEHVVTVTVAHELGHVFAGKNSRHTETGLMAWTYNAETLPCPDEAALALVADGGVLAVPRLQPCE